MKLKFRFTSIKFLYAFYSSGIFQLEIIFRNFFWHFCASKFPKKEKMPSGEGKSKIVQKS